MVPFQRLNGRKIRVCMFALKIDGMPDSRPFREGISSGENRCGSVCLQERHPRSALGLKSVVLDIDMTNFIRIARMAFAETNFDKQPKIMQVRHHPAGCASYEGSVAFASFLRRAGRLCPCLDGRSSAAELHCHSWGLVHPFHVLYTTTNEVVYRHDLRSAISVST